jgi:hypothetical protein
MSINLYLAELLIGIILVVLSVFFVNPRTYYFCFDFLFPFLLYEFVGLFFFVLIGIWGFHGLFGIYNAPIIVIHLPLIIVTIFNYGVCVINARIKKGKTIKSIIIILVNAGVPVLQITIIFFLIFSTIP